MKKPTRKVKKFLALRRQARLGRTLVSASLFIAALHGRAAETNAVAPLTPEQMYEGGTNTYKNWFELSAGDMFTSGNKAEAQQINQRPSGPFGGIEDAHYQD